MPFKELKPMTDKDASAKLRSIFDDLQTRFHDQWDWMDAEFSLQVLEVYISSAKEEWKKLHTLRPASEWHEDYGTVLWHHLPIQEPPHVGTPLDCDWDAFDEGYYTHWSPIPMNPTIAGEPDEAHS